MIEPINHDKELSLIFVNYRSILHLSLALESLQQDMFFRQHTEVIVVNQDIDEQTAARKLSEQRGFRLIDRENLGFASGANEGASVSTGTYLAFLNPDIRQYSGSLREGVLALRKDTRLGVVGATLLNKENTPEKWSKGRFITLFRLIGNNIFPAIHRARGRKVDWVSGGALFIKKERFQSLGGFDEDFFLYFEDMDLCQRAKKDGFHTESIDTIRFSHQGGQSFSSKQVQKKHYFDSQRRYFRKHRPRWEQTLLSVFQNIKIW